MSNHTHDDLTDEEKALLKRDMKYRIEQQRAREELEAILPKIFIAAGAICLIGMLFILASSFKSSGNLWCILPFISIPGVLLLLIGAGTLWETQRHKPHGDKRKRS